MDTLSVVYVVLLINWWHYTVWSCSQPPVWPLSDVRTITTTRSQLWRNSSFPRKSAIKSSWQQPARWSTRSIFLRCWSNAINLTFHSSFQKQRGWKPGLAGRTSASDFSTPQDWVSTRGREGQGRAHHPRHLFKIFTWRPGPSWPSNSAVLARS